MNNAIQHIHDAVKSFHETVAGDDAPPQQIETIYCPADIYDACIDQARQFYPAIRFVREPDFDGFLTVASDPLDVN